MSWIIQSLLNRKNWIEEIGDIESDEYNDLILVEKAITELSKAGVISKEDLDIIAEMTGDVQGFESRPKTQKETASRRFMAICERVAFAMGDYFTDDGYLSYMKEKHNLTDEQIEILQNYIRSPFKHKIMRKSSLTGYSYKPNLQGTANG